MAPLVKEFQQHQDKLETIVCVIKKAPEMLNRVLQIFDITPDFELNIIEKEGNLHQRAAQVMLEMQRMMEQVRPDVVLVHGETTTSTAAALAAFYQQIPVGHIEAGLRTYRIDQPWPGEMNRRLIGCMARYHFAPTPLCREHLLQENITDSHIVVTGNTVVDAMHYVIERIYTDSALDEQLTKILALAGYNIARLFTGRKMVLLTMNGAWHTETGVESIAQAMKTLVTRYPQVDFVYSAPQGLRQILTGKLEHADHVFVMEPLEYLPFVLLMEKSSVILTDSGGVQEEAPGIGKPVLVLREITDRPEALQAGTVKLVGTDNNKIVESVSLLLENPEEYKRMSRAENPYGDGKASARIVNFFTKTYDCI